MARRISGSHGAFRTPESSPRADDLSAAWAEKWPKADPLASRIRGGKKRWVRFHSLPNSKSTAETAAESAEILNRHREVLAELLGGSTGVLVLGADWDWRDDAAGIVRRLMPAAWPWRVVQTDSDGSMSYVWAAELDVVYLDPVLTAVADDRASVIIADPALDWLYAPYYAGADVYARSPAQRDSLKLKHADWLSSRADGL